MRTELSFFVEGHPAPKGSMKAFAFKRKNGKLGASVTHDNKRTSPWSATVAAAACTAMDGNSASTHPMHVEIKFSMARPKSHIKKRGGLRSSAPSLHTNRPDIDKLARLVLDAMTRVVWKDDSQVCSLAVTKLYSDNPGVKVSVWGEWSKADE